MCFCFKLEDVELSVADHVQKVIKPNFNAAWEEIGESNELEDTYALSSMKTVEGGWYNFITLLLVSGKPRLSALNTE